jgi:SAM-dependent methyltransferase
MRYLCQKIVIASHHRLEAGSCWRGGRRRWFEYHHPNEWHFVRPAQQCSLRLLLQYSTTTTTPASDAGSTTNSADDRSGYSSSWASVDTNRHDPTALVTPDPVEYLRHFDQCQAVQAYRQAVVNAAQLKPGMSVLNVGCGLGGLTPFIRQQVGSSGRILSVDLSSHLVAHAQELHPHETFQVGDVYDLQDIPSNSFDVVLEDRVLQHLTRPQEAVQEMLRVCRSTLVCGQPDWRTFALDVPSAGYHSSLKEAGRRWGDIRRPPRELTFDLGHRTRRVLEGVIPELSAYSYLGVALPRLLRSVGCHVVSSVPPSNGDLNIVPAIMQGRKEIETVVPITYFARLAANNGTVTEKEAQEWLDRLEWEEQTTSADGGEEHDDSLQETNPLFATLNFYVCRGQKPSHYTLNAQVHVATQTDEDFIQEVTHIVNQAYRYSDYNITLSTERIPAEEVVGMVQRKELLVARDCTTDEILGAIQYNIKGSSNSSSQPGLPEVGDGQQLVGEFSMLAVKAHQDNSQAGGTFGIGSMLVRAAEAKCRTAGCGLMNLGILCPAVSGEEEEPAYKQWLQRWYLKLGYEHRETLYLRFKPDEIREMYSYLGQVAPCKYILYDKAL